MQSPEGLSHAIPPVGILGKVCIIVIAAHSYKKRVIISAREIPEETLAKASRHFPPDVESTQI